MKNIWLFCLLSLIALACNKASTTTAAGAIPPAMPPADTTVVKDTAVVAPPPAKNDSINLVESRWKGYRDSIVNNNYDDPYGGYPIPGVIYNPPSDYWNFLPNGILNAVINNNFYSVTYSYSGTNQITIHDPPQNPEDNFIITVLTDSSFIFFTADTSQIGGTYYRQVWLKK